MNVPLLNLVLVLTAGLTSTAFRLSGHSLGSCQSSYYSTALGAFDVGMEKLSAVNAELLAKKEGKELVGVKTGGVQPLTRCPKKIVHAKPETVNKLLEREGCLSIPAILSADTADLLLDYVNIENERAKREVEEDLVGFDYRFGGVNCRGLNGMFGNRQDMYLPIQEPLVQRGLKDAFTSLLPLLDASVTREGMND
mmetsp:Transcript_9725/g.16064  ORF Transcript_9725/g.16064 Transcript_9725/m.16064 type:complete len:196 (+) Transcript_9725:187-774(+)